MTRFKLLACCAIAAVAALGTQAQAATVTVSKSTAPWLGYMNWTDIDNSPADDGGGGWGVADLVATFDDGAGTLTLSPNQIGDPNPYWYPDGTAAPGGKIMQANLYQEVTGALAGQTVTFEGNVLSDTTSADYSARIFVSDFAPDYSSRVDSFFDITTAGPFSVSLATINDAARHVQYGFQFIGQNIFPDAGNAQLLAAAGSVVIGTVPEPASLTLVGLCGLALVGIRRRSL
ncbi:PEP-CTERM sorting domain-containing protein [Bythopirellula polymerisocia]|uniref:Ice-binding protein C-terminal domain-containing protein n=1 Tax=Bythopirellula polymerisocia TaxID=2528003 RepID=A0A5C6CZ09_9BACT|nr:PEP-CTERM sorting domain-containing protein [Bythopirellula polymerisocia]TWU29820.1 hypothetical protein Pla144_05990 [Bythopirellula polymerisocia]